MNDYLSNTTYDSLARRLLDASRVVIATHAKPDGDAYGSVAALAAALRALGKQVDAPLLPPVPDQFQGLLGRDLVRTFTGELPAMEPDVIVIVDTGSWQQVGDLRPYLEPRVARTAIVDHHLSGDIPAAWRIIDTQAGACCEMVWQLIEALGAAAGKDIAQPWAAILYEAIYVGIASDTGWFRFSNTRPVTHELAAALLRHGVDHAQLYLKLELNEHPRKLALMIRALDSVELLAGGKAAMMVLGPEDFIASGAQVQDTERFVDLPQIVGSVRVVALVVLPAPSENHETGLPGEELPGADLPGVVERIQGPLTAEGIVRVSFRSKPGEGAIDVAAVANRFGGGGHARAAGAKVRGELGDVAAQVRAALEEATGGIGL